MVDLKKVKMLPDGYTIFRFSFYASSA